VRDVMKAQDALEVLDFEASRTAKVGHIVSTLKRSGRQYAVVAERGSSPHMVRGVFSATQIARQLGVAIPISAVARTFAEIEAQLAR